MQPSGGHEGGFRSTSRVERLAHLVVELGANVQPGQIVAVTAYVGGHEEMARAVARVAYKRGAKFVDIAWFDPLVKRERVAFADDETLDFVPTWYRDRFVQLGAQRGARIALAGLVVPGAMNGLDPSRVGKDQLPHQREISELNSDRTTNWCAVPIPTRAWATLVFAELEPEAAYERLWQQLEHVLRLDEADPAAAWSRRLGTLKARAALLTARRFQAIHFQGPGTDLTVGLLPTSTFQTAEFTTVDGIRHVANLPSEEIFTSPNPHRTEGYVTSTRPLGFRDGAIVEGLHVRFESGRAVEIDARENADVLRSLAAHDEGARLLGEIAIVDHKSRVGSLGTVFTDPLLDENAASHLALGHGFAFAVGSEDEARVNRSAIHVDFMVGSDEVAVTGVTEEARRVPILRGGSWVLSRT